MALPIPRLPECSMTHTWSDSSKADLDEMVAPAERAHLVYPFRKLAEGLEQLRMLLRHKIQTSLEGLRGIDQHPVVRMLGAADRHVAADLVEHLLQRLFVDIVGGEATGGRPPCRSRCRHADSRGNDGLVGGDHRTDGRADAQMHVRHGRHVVVNEGQGWRCSPAAASIFRRPRRSRF
jgi:hypothetical protein